MSNWSLVNILQAPHATSEGLYSSNSWVCGQINKDLLSQLRLPVEVWCGSWVRVKLQVQRCIFPYDCCPSQSGRNGDSKSIIIPRKSLAGMPRPSRSDIFVSRPATIVTRSIQSLVPRSSLAKVWKCSRQPANQGLGTMS